MMWENGFQPKYSTIKGKGDIIKRLKQLAQTSKRVLIATDPDREGEAIAWHLAEEVKQKNDNVQRVLFNEITKTGIKKGIDDPREIDTNLFMSQQARRVMDRLIGYQVSPFLSRALLEVTSKPLSAGRVQSVALRMICEREQEIRDFEPIEYWNLNAQFDVDSGKKLEARLVEFDLKSMKNPEGSAKVFKENGKYHFINNKEQADDILTRVKNEDYQVSSVQKRKVKRNPQSPFTTSLMQQEASKRLGFSNKKTMMIAQKLYEGVTLGEEGQVGLITYMRTDSTRLSPEAESSARDFIAKEYGNEYMPKSSPKYTSKKSNIQDAHEAIRPTSTIYSPKSLRSKLSKDEYKLYELILIVS